MGMIKESDFRAAPRLCSEAPPGEGSMPLLDPTVRFGGKTLWEHGRLLLADDPTFRQRIARWGDPQALLRANQDVGVRKPRVPCRDRSRYGRARNRLALPRRMAPRCVGARSRPWMRRPGAFSRIRNG